MNKFSGRISDIQVSGSLSLVAVKLSESLTLKAIIIATPATTDYLKLGNAINILFKETEVVMGTAAEHAISLQNRIPATVSQIEQGQLICKLRLQTEMGEIISIISTNAVKNLALKVNSKVMAMIKLNEMMLSE